MDRTKVEQGARLLLEGLGVDITNHNFNTTPKRVADVYEEMFCPPETGWPVFDEKYTDIVVLRKHLFYTMCPHHLLPVKIETSVAYIPNGKVIGASKLARAIHEANRQPETQEALTDKVIKKLYELTQNTSLGEAVVMEGRHGCFEIRGIRSQASMLTSKFSGLFKESTWEQRFWNLVNR